MKKLALLCIFCLFSLSVRAEDCANGAGTIYIGGDGSTRYCLSKIEMNWWSANAWCKTVTGRDGSLFDMTTECRKSSGNGICPQLDNADHLYYIAAWTQNTLDASTAYWYELGYKNSNSLGRSAQHNGNNTQRALCMM